VHKSILTIISYYCRIVKDRCSPGIDWDCTEKIQNRNTTDYVLSDSESDWEVDNFIVPIAGFPTISILFMLYRIFTHPIYKMYFKIIKK